MKRCNFCFRYAPGEPTYCTTCGRTYDVRICSRGHVNGRGGQFCAECGSEELSTPAPPEGWLARLSRWSLQILVGASVGLTIVSAVLALFYLIDWPQVMSRLVLLFLMLGFLYWTTTLLPGPIKKIGKTSQKVSKWMAARDRRKR